MASKILLGAFYKADQIHPLEYCLKAAGVEIEIIPHRSDEFNLLHEYAANTYIDQQRKSIKNIFRLNKHSE